MLKLKLKLMLEVKSKLLVDFQMLRATMQLKAARARWQLESVQIMSQLRYGEIVDNNV